MRTVATPLGLVAVCVVSIILASVRAGEADPKRRAGRKPAAGNGPLRLSEDEPLRLADEAPADDDGRQADNSRCHVCHLNFSLERLAVEHAREGIGCPDCHGNCDAHIDDESWASGGPGTPPGIMYPAERIDPACGKCHQTHDAPARKILQRWRQRCPQKADPAKIVCTDCHGKHRLNPDLRKAWWDKATGKPIKPIKPNRPDAGSG